MEIAGTPLAIVVLGIIAAIIIMVAVMRNLYSRRTENGIAGEFKGQSETLAGNRTKYAAVDAFKYSGTFFNLGLAVALGLAVLAFGWTKYEDEVVIPEGALEMEDDIIMEEPPRTAEPPPPPPPPPPVIEEVPDDTILEDEEQQDQSITKDEAPPPPPPPPPAVEEIFKVVEQMPRFPGCEDLGSEEEKKKCAQDELLKFIYKNIKYPAIARENGVEGTVVVTFVVEKDGAVTDARVVRDIGAQCGDEALRVVELMNKQGIKWTPGKQRGRSVRVQFNLPVKFKLE